MPSCVANMYALAYDSPMNRSAPHQPTLETVRTVLKRVCGHLPVARVQAFGSLVEGTQHARSDVDLLVEFLPGARVGLLEMGAMKEDLEEQLGCSVDLVSRHAVEQSRNPYRRQAILAAPVTVYAR